MTSPAANRMSKLTRNSIKENSKQVSPALRNWTGMRSGEWGCRHSRGNENTDKCHKTAEESKVLITFYLSSRWRRKQLAWRQQQQPLTDVWVSRWLCKRLRVPRRCWKTLYQCGQFSVCGRIWHDSEGGEAILQWSCDPVRSHRLVAMMRQRDVDDGTSDQLANSLYSCWPLTP